MWTTIYLADPLLAEAKRLAAERGTTLTSLVEEALREMLMRRRQPQARRRVRLATFHGRGLQPGIDLDDTATLLDQLENRRGPV